jgi:hypothetical protein
MNIQTILFMCNDFERAFFTLHSFRRHHSNIPIRVINAGGKDPSKYLSSIGVEVINTDNLWHKKTHCGVGSFSPDFANHLFEYGLNPKYDYTLFLETDVLTNRTIKIKPKYHISGVTNPCGPKESILYTHLGITNNFLHTGCGGTIFSKEYFSHIHNTNFHFFTEMFIKYPENYFMDLILTLAARTAGLSFGYWEEVSNIPIHFIGDKQYNANYNQTLVHNFKI